MKKRRFLSFLFVCVLSLSLSVPAFASEGFTDVSDNAYYAEAIRWAISNGITEGVGNNQFNPNGTVTRAQAVVFLWRSVGKPTPRKTGETFVDVEKGSWYEKAVQWAVAEGITNGVGNDRFNPEGTLTRGQLITLIYRAKGGSTQSGSNWYTAAEQWANNKGLLTGTAQPYKNDSQCPRCDTVYYLWKEMKSTSGDSGNTGNGNEDANGNGIPDWMENPADVGENEVGGEGDSPSQGDSETDINAG